MFKQVKKTRFDTYGEAFTFALGLEPNKKQNAAKPRKRVRIRRRPAGHFDVVESREAKTKEKETDGR